MEDIKITIPSLAATVIPTQSVEKVASFQLILSRVLIGLTQTILDYIYAIAASF